MKDAAPMIRKSPTSTIFSIPTSPVSLRLLLCHFDFPYVVANEVKQSSRPKPWIAAGAYAKTDEKLLPVALVYAMTVGKLCRATLLLDDDKVMVSRCVAS